MVLWSNRAGDHAVELWQVEQFRGKPDVTWFGLVVLLKSSRWQESQAVGRPVYCPFLWQASHC